jgi:hypothetical protein
MTAVYYDELIKKYPKLKGNQTASPKQIVPKSKRSTKRKAENEIKNESTNQSPRKKPKMELSEAVTSGTQKHPSEVNKETCSILELESEADPCVDAPLLQLPTGSAKMYTRVDLENKQVWKGPYKGDRLGLVMFLHRVLNEVLKDPHTLKIQRKGSYVQFPLLCAADASMKITVKDFYDCIGKQQVKDGKFVNRESLGIIQVHKLGAASFRNIPASFWCHYLFRYMLNIGDSGLYNSITDNKMSFLYGIDMEEIRKSVMGHDLLNLMFVKLPKRELKDPIMDALRRNKEAASKIMIQQFDIDKIEALAQFYSVKTFDKCEFQNRLDTARKALKMLH